jgi:hypothetical protein
LDIENNDNIGGDDKPKYRKRNAGNIFAVDRRAWAKVCDIGLNAAVAYLMLARGSGGDQRTVWWSVNALEKRTGISRPNAKKAIETLKQHGLVRQIKAGTKPQYYIVPAHELTGGRKRRVDLTAAEARVLAAIEAGHRRPPKKGGGDLWGPGNCALIAVDLERAGWVRRIDYQEYEPVGARVDEEQPDWIWLPNSILDGVGDEIPPVERIRQSQNIAPLKLLINLYHAHELLSFGGVNWRPGAVGIRQQYERHRIGEYGQYVVWGFDPQGTEAHLSFAEPFFTGEIKPQLFGGKEYTVDVGWRIFWDAFNFLKENGLIQVIPHLVESYTDEGEVILSQGYDGEDGESAVATATEGAAYAMLAEWQMKRAEAEGYQYLIPALKHLTNVQLVGVVRLRYRPQTEATALWFKQSSARCDEWAKRYSEIEATIRGLSPSHATSRLNQG